jgi:hypothetical protein
MNHGMHMSQLDRRHFAVMAVGSFAAFFSTVRPTDALDAKKQRFVAEAARMKQETIASADTGRAGWLPTAISMHTLSALRFGKPNVDWAPAIFLAR